jgi:predicted mannosyl-3-phosphoglycerate phosphatase (HAD superfamily)
MAKKSESREFASEIRPDRKRFTLRLKEEAIDVELPDGTEVSYLMRELDGDLRDAYLNRLAKRARQNNVHDFTGLFSSLLTLAMWQENDEGVWVRISEKEVQKWPSTMQKELFDMAKVMSGLDDAKKQEGESSDEDPEKN